MILIYVYRDHLFNPSSIQLSYKEFILALDCIYSTTTNTTHNTSTTLTTNNTTTNSNSNHTGNKQWEHRLLFLFLLYADLLLSTPTSSTSLSEAGRGNSSSIEPVIIDISTHHTHRHLHQYNNSSKRNGKKPPRPSYFNSKQQSTDDLGGKGESDNSNNNNNNDTHNNNITSVAHNNTDNSYMNINTQHTQHNSNNNRPRRRSTRHSGEMSLDMSEASADTEATADSYHTTPTLTLSERKGGERNDNKIAPSPLKSKTKDNNTNNTNNSSKVDNDKYDEDVSYELGLSRGAFEGLLRLLLTSDLLSYSHNNKICDQYLDSHTKHTTANTSNNNNNNAMPTETERSHGHQSSGRSSSTSDHSPRYHTEQWLSYLTTVPLISRLLLPTGEETRDRSNPLAQVFGYRHSSSGGGRGRKTTTSVSPVVSGVDGVDDDGSQPPHSARRMDKSHLTFNDLLELARECRLPPPSPLPYSSITPAITTDRASYSTSLPPLPPSPPTGQVTPNQLTQSLFHDKTIDSVLSLFRLVTTADEVIALIYIYIHLLIHILQSSIYILHIGG